MDGINWDGLKGRNIFADFASGMEYGSEMRARRAKAEQEAARRQALNLYATDPAEAERALMAAGDIETANAIRTRTRQDRQDKARTDASARYAKGDAAGAQQAALEAGEFDLAKSIAGLDADKRKMARENAEDLGGFAIGIRNVPYEQRKAIIAQARPILMQKGFTAEQIAAFDPTDENITALAASAMGLKEALQQADREADNKRADQQFEETKRHNRAGEAVASQNAATSAFSARTGRMSFEERKKAGGFGTPGGMPVPTGKQY